MTITLGSIGAGSNEWARDLSASDSVGVDGRQVGCEGNCGEYREGSRVVVADTFHT